MAVVVHIRFLMEGIAYPMTSQVTHNTIAVFLAMLLNGMADISHESVGLGGLHAYLQALFCHSHQLFLLWRGLADDEHTTGVGIIAVEDGGEVHVDNIALFEHILLFGYTVTNHLVDRSADRHRERWCILVAAIVQAGGNGMMVLTVLTAYPIDLQRIHALMDGSGHSVEHTRVHDTRPADAFYLLRCLDQLTRRHFLTPVLPVHNGLIHLRRLLPTQTMPPSFLLENVHIPYYI